MQWYPGTEWKLERKGLRKTVVSIEFTRLDKPDLVSKVIIKVLEVATHLNGRPSKYLDGQNVNVEQELEMGTALTPIDCYIEILVQQMIVGERARCYIKTRQQEEEITFMLSLERIVETRQIHTLDVREMHTLALRYKESGVAMFKQYPSFAHDYFARAAKCLISYKPFDSLTKKRNGVAGSEMQALFIQIQTNLAACLLTEKRYEDVLYQTKFVDTTETPSEKSIYRRAMALYHRKEFEEALRTIEKQPNHQEKHEFVKLRQHIAESSKAYNSDYKHLVKRMFHGLIME